jgi:hypothetical protein
MEKGTAEITHRKAVGTVSTLNEKEIYHIAFKTSRYNTFEEKLKTFEKQSEGWRKYVYAYIHDINTNLREPELFDAYELGALGDSTKIVKLVAQTNNTDWYNETLYKEMYQSQTYLQTPNDKVFISQMNVPNKLLTDDEINVNIASGYNADGIIKYSLSNYCSQDMYKAKEEISRKVLDNKSISSQERAILNQNFPPVVFKGNYPITASYTLPGKNIVTSTVNFNMYNPVPHF